MPELPALRGRPKLEFALAAFGLDVEGRTALDVGAAAGGFTQALLEAGARRVYAVDAGHGQLLGVLRQDSRVICCERTNLADLGPDRITEPLDIVALDLSYLSLADAIPQLASLEVTSGADLVALVKPMFELRLARAPIDATSVLRAAGLAAEGAAAAGWDVRSAVGSPYAGGRGAREAFLHAVWT